MTAPLSLTALARVVAGASTDDGDAADWAVARFGYCLADSRAERNAMRAFVIETRQSARAALDPETVGRLVEVAKVALLILERGHVDDCCHDALATAVEGIVDA